MNINGWQGDGTMVIDPFQLIAAFAAVLFVLVIVRIKKAYPWPWQFSLRTLLTTMTLIAVVLGAAGFALRQ